MTAKAGAPSGQTQTTWESINWNHVESQVKRLQVRIAKAIKEGKHGKVKSLQWILTHSYSAKILAIRKVTENKGGKTPGIDGEIWRTNKQKLNAVNKLKRRGYSPLPLRRV